MTYLPVESNRILHKMPIRFGWSRIIADSNLIIFVTKLGLMSIGIFGIYKKDSWESQATSRFYLNPGTYQLGRKERMIRINVTRDEFNGLVFDIEKKVDDEEDKFKKIILDNNSISLIHLLKIKKIEKEFKEI